MHLDPNANIKKKLITTPLLANTAVTLTTLFVTLLLLRFYNNTDFTIPLLPLGIAIFVLLITSAFITTHLMHKNFINRLDMVQNGLFTFFDYLAGKRKEISYIPVHTGAIGDAINASIEEIEKQHQKNRAFIREMIALVQEVEKGRYNGKLYTQPANEALQIAAEAINRILSSLQKHIGSDLNTILQVIEKYANEDYRTRIKNPKSNVENAINRLGDIISNMLQNDYHHSHKIKQKALIVNHNIGTVYRNIDEKLKKEMEIIIDTVNEITSHIQKNVESASFISSFTQTVRESAKEGEELAEKTASAMLDIKEQVETIEKALMLIDKITMQTNILSLNAAVEASTAGEAGKGFAVVAQEVRNLAAKTADASKTIKQIVDDAREKAEAGNKISTEMIEGYRRLVTQIAETTRIVYDITQTSNSQDRQIQQIHTLTSGMQKMIEENLSVLAVAKQNAKENYTLADHIVNQTAQKEFTTQAVS